ncbi:hypothetical protein SAMN06265348_103317 [Pedobacter westerhofensis]|uniref:Transposase n=1 Tax=Pedobacter westerhofensis TaxID=425512 RepID=A0A521CAF1_9SPHI|nr:hypothetical protein SAMN06265348_103317 [Pedobacter westerhofensis]
MVQSNNTEDWVNIIPSYPDCPHCHQGKLDTRVKRAFIVRKLFIWMDVKRYQCNACGKKVYLKNHAHDQRHRQFSNI